MARPHHVYTSSRLVVFVLVLLVDAQDPVDSCVSNINLRKNTVYVVSSGSMLNISCPVSYCKDVPTVKWIKIDHTNNFIVISETNQITITQIQKEPKTIISYLSIRNVSKIEQGFYRCMISYSNFSSESHNIIVNVSEKETKAGIGVQATYISWFLYIFICVGILSLVMVVMLSSLLCINQCSRKSNSHRQNEYTQDMRNRSKSNDVLREIVYATLQHPAPREESAVWHVSTEQLVEYASIQIA
ncbi:B- and T-lymphocyte attenuator-like [Silurus meridionalis]|uniref:Ig-like domain-containing protein n=1 Tax=Silurus meridionalis TaxID=175797 RepID=A0A8T0BV49_SILME|nr:B- and T-lymphocyte attenuator-like [Silurus meridionalis]KAF7709210.1 hypothetical protein HF521_016060 [Silurus meridionalis]